MYTPIVKWKAGERQALQQLSPAVKAQVRPLIEMVKPSAAFPDELQRVWGSSEVLLDARPVEDEPPPAGASWLAWSIAESAKRNLRLVPVATTDGDLISAAELARIYRRGCALRVPQSVLFEDALRDRVSDAIGQLGLGAEEIDLILDLGAVDESSVRATRTAALSVASLVAPAWPWRSVVLAAGSYPESLSGVPRGLSRVRRLDRDVWKHIAAHVETDIGFADYGAGHPILPDIDYSKATMSAKVTYSTPDEWIIVKGQKISDHPKGWGQTVELCRLLLNEPDFDGAAASWGDEFIDNVANLQDRTGNATTWVAVKTNRHITATVQSLRSATHGAL